MPYNDLSKELEWRKKKQRRVVLDLSRISENDIIDWLEKQPSMQGAIKDLIRKEIERENS